MSGECPRTGTAVSIPLRKEEHMCLREVRDKAEKGQIIKRPWMLGKGKSMQFQNIKHQHTVKNQNEGKRRKVADTSRNERPGSQSQIEQAAPTLSSCKDTRSSKVLDHQHFSYSHCFSFVAIHQVASEVCEVHQNIELFLFSYSTHSRLLICFLKFFCLFHKDLDSGS